MVKVDRNTLFKKYHSNWVIDKHLMNNPIVHLKGVFNLKNIIFYI